MFKCILQDTRSTISCYSGNTFDKNLHGKYRRQRWRTPYRWRNDLKVKTKLMPMNMKYKCRVRKFVGCSQGGWGSTDSSEPLFSTAVSLNIQMCWNAFICHFEALNSVYRISGIHCLRKSCVRSLWCFMCKS